MIITFLAKLLAKTLQFYLYNFSNSRGETAPGLIALKIDPNFVSHTNRSIKNRIIVAGTNGKTTTTRMISNIFKQQKINYVHNRSGSNLLRGIATSSLNINSKTNYLLWEADEAALIQIAQQVKPTHILFTNLFRDQLDRYGEINSIIDKWINLLNKIPKTNLIINADDPSLISMVNKIKKHKIIYYGINSIQNCKIDNYADAIFCPDCGKQLNYKQVNFSHLGNYNCNCGFIRPKAEYQLIKHNFKANKSQIRIKYKNKQTNINYPLTGKYNLYNALSAYTLSDQLTINPQNIKLGLQNFKPAFGRQEIIKIKNKNFRLILSKNPTGFNQSIESILLIKSSKKPIILLAINDRLADGTDISWLWDVEFEKIGKISNQIYVTGDRYLDMLVRLKYADIKIDNKHYHHKYSSIIKALINQDNNNIIVLSTYTAMLDIRKEIKKHK